MPFIAEGRHRNGWHRARPGEIRNAKSQTLVDVDTTANVAFIGSFRQGNSHHYFMRNPSDVKFTMDPATGRYVDEGGIVVATPKSAGVDAGIYLSGYAVDDTVGLDLFRFARQHDIQILVVADGNVVYVSPRHATGGGVDSGHVGEL